MGKAKLNSLFDMKDIENLITKLRRECWQKGMEDAARICDLRASKKGKDDEADNEAQVCASLIRYKANGHDSTNRKHK